MTYFAYLQDELQTTSKSYEGQLSMMSEHLASMNEKLAKQKDEIDELSAHTHSHKVSFHWFILTKGPFSLAVVLLIDWSECYNAYEDRFHWFLQDQF